jgi:hypothetical protein
MSAEASLICRKPHEQYDFSPISFFSVLSVLASSGSSLQYELSALCIAVGASIAVGAISVLNELGH